MLITKFVSIKLISSNVRYYNNLGYNGNVKDIVDVKVEDLPKQSHVYVDVYCDLCLAENNYNLLHKEYREFLEGRSKHSDIDLCQSCALKRIIDNSRLDGLIVYEYFKNEKDLIPLFNPDDYINRHHKLPFKCKKHNEVIQHISLNNLRNSPYGCKYCAFESTHGTNHYNYQSGLSKLSSYLRLFLTEWKNKSLQNCNYLCVLSGSKKKIKIHHLYSCNLIIKDILKELSIKKYKKIGDYSVNELLLIKEKFIEKHKQLLGVCLTDSIHKLFHILYGYKNTPEQFEEFKIRYRLGEFKDILNQSS